MRHARLTSLDGLRGVASVVVLLHHAFLLDAGLTAVYFGGPVPGGLTGLLAYGPLHLVWAGQEAVLLFFVLSGLVLGMATIGPDQNWGRYLPSRLVRLYLPVWAVVLLTWVSTIVIPRQSALGSRWLTERPLAYSPQSFLQDLYLVSGHSGMISPLWSLVWEIVFSLLLPVYVMIARAVPPLWTALCAFALASMGILIGSPAFTYLPMFAIGVAAARAWPSLTAAAERLNSHRWRWAVWLSILVVGLALTDSLWLLGHHPDGTDLGWTSILVLLGVTMIVAVAAFSPLARRLLSLRPIRWLGTISFSLYLVHEPIVVGAGELLTAHPRLAGAIALVLAFPVAYVFHRFVERPAHRLARRVGRVGTPPLVSRPEAVGGASLPPRPDAPGHV